MRTAAAMQCNGLIVLQHAGLRLHQPVHVIVVHIYSLLRDCSKQLRTDQFSELIHSLAYTAMPTRQPASQ